MKTTLKIFAVLVGNLLALPVHAQSAAAKGGDPENITYQAPTTRYDFDDDVVEGELSRPDLAVVGVRKRAVHPSLIKVRENFVPEMIKSADDR